ncbi:phycocyanin alpha subunit [[Synechococcus] sp. NIES-970]|nr:phycocyanin alpha subunit [[Synechococcus] sp. NIES-970]
MDAASLIYAKAYNQSRFLSNSELDCLRKCVADGLANIEAAQEITNNCDSLIQESYEAIRNDFPEHASKIEDWQKKCRRDIDYFLRVITYCLVSENTSLLNKYFLNDIDLALHIDCLVLALSTILKSNFISKQSLEIITPYVNHIISNIIRSSEAQLFSEVTSDEFPRKWPEELAEFYGSIQDESFDRQPQPEIGGREEL